MASLVLCAWVGGVGCGRGSAAGPETGEPAPPRGALVGEWSFHPRQASALTAALDLAEGRRLEVDAAGSRWLVDAAGGAEASPFGAPEPLVGLARVGERWAVLGRSGTVRFFSEPLGPFVETRLPPERFVSAARVEGRLLGVSRAGRLFESDSWGRAWAPRPEEAFFSDVFALAGGEALALSIPEQWWRSGDSGVSWSVARVGPVAPERFQVRPSGGVVVEALLGTVRWEGGAFVASPAPPENAPARRLPRFAGAAALAAGQAVESRGRLVAFERSEPGGWSVLRGAWDEPLEERKEPLLSGCGALRAVGAGAFVFVVCQADKSSGVSPRLELLVSEDGGVSFRRRLSGALRGQLPEIVAAASPSGQLVLRGICPPESSEAGCAPSGVHLLGVGADKLIPAPLVPLSFPRRLAFDSFGRVLGAGRRVSDGHLIFFRAPTRVEATDEVRIVDVDASLDLPPERSEAGLELWPGPGGIATVTARAGSRRVVVRFDEDAAIWSDAELPPGTDRWSGAGTRLAALDPRSGLLWLSDSAGLDWSRDELPRAVCVPSVRSCDVALHCAEQGCLVGEELVRTGWGVGASVVASRPIDDVPAAAPEGAYGAPLLCKVQGAAEELSRLASLPSASDAMLGDVSWVQVESDPERAAAWAIHAPLGKKQLTRVELLAPVADAERYAFAVSEQIEGSAAVRYLVPPRGPRDPVVRQVEVAWDNRVTGTIGRGRLPGEHKPQPGDFETRGSGSERARPGLLSVAGAGLYLRLHRSKTFTQSTYYFEAGQVEILSSPRWPAKLQGGDDEVVRVGARHVPFLWLRDGQLVVRDGPVGLTPLLLSPLDAAARGLSATSGLAYVGTQPSLLSVVRDLEGNFSRASVVPLEEDRAYAAPRRVPLQADLPERPELCSVEARRATARVVAPTDVSRVREVFIDDPRGRRLRLLTRRAVLHGSVEEPCVALFEAEATEATSEGASRHRALVAPDAAEIGWLFHEERRADGSRSIQGYPLACQAVPLEASAP